MSATMTDPSATVSPGAITLSFPEPNIALLTLDDPVRGANILSQSVLAELSGHLDALEKRSDIAGLIIASAKPGIFIAGADLKEFAASLDFRPEQTEALCTRGRTLFQRMSQTPWPTIAAIDGICVGGGAELACWCDHRIFGTNPAAQIGFPEVKLGLYPGWGGTARATRIAGLANAVELITSGESIPGRAAQQMGLAWDVTPSEQLLAAAIKLLRWEAQTKSYLQQRDQWNRGIVLSENELAFLAATASAYIQSQTKGQYPAPLAALELMLDAAGDDIETACKKEAAGMSQLFGTPINRALINVFFLGDRNKKDSGVSETSASAPPAKRIAVIGSGIMGQGIAAACIKRDVGVILSDASAEALAKGMKSVLEEASYDKETRGTDAGKMAKLAPLLNQSQSESELSGADIVIEAIVENLDVKQQLFAKVEPAIRDQAVLASNTSTIPIGKLAAKLKRPDRFCGIHFFNPVRKMQLVEVIRGPQTSDETVDLATAFAKRIGKSPVVVNDGPGFLGNRLLFPYMNEAVALLLEGVPAKYVEKAAKEYGMPMGPLTLYDVVGLDTALYAGRVMYEAFPDRVEAGPLLPAMVKAGRLGQKNGKGFYRYTGKSDKGEPDPDFDRLLDGYRSAPKKLSPEQTTERLFLPMLVEAIRAMDEGIARNVRDVDLALIYGLGFPPFRGGLFFWADQVGASKLVEMLAPLEGLGKRFEVPQRLKEMAATGRKFYDG